MIPHRRQRVGAGALLAAGVAVFVAASLPDALQRPADKTDWQIYARCHARFWAGDAPYADAAFRSECFYPPSAYHLLQPFFRDPGPGAARAWALVVLAFTVAAFLLPLALRPAGGDPRAGPVVAALWVLLLAAEPFTDSAGRGNVSAVVAALLLAAVLLVERAPAWAAVVAGALVGAVAAVKLYPIAYGACLLATGVLRRRPRQAVAGGVAVAVFLGLQALPGTGDFWAFTLSSSGFVAEVAARGSNSSPMAFLHRLGVPLQPVLLQGAVAVATAWLVLSRDRGHRVEAALVFLATLWMSPVVWAHTLTLLGLPLVLALDGTVREWLPGGGGPADGDRARRTLRLLALVYAFGIAWQSNQFSLREEWFSTIGTALGCSVVPILAWLLVSRDSPKALHNPDRLC